MEVLGDIAGRLRALREIQGMSLAEVSKALDVDESEYTEIESGKKDFSASLLLKAAEVLGVDATELLTGDSPKLSTFTVTKKGEGMSIKRREGFEYKSLAYLFKNRLSEPFLVKAPYSAEDTEKPIPLSSHEGQEFDYVLKGKLKVQIKDKVCILNEGDIIYYDSLNPHGMIASDGPCEFLAVVIRKHQER